MLLLEAVAKIHLYPSAMQEMKKTHSRKLQKL